MRVLELRWVDLGQLPNTHPAALSLLLLNRTEKMRWKSSCVETDREIIYQLPSQEKQASLGDN